MLSRLGKGLLVGIQHWDGGELGAWGSGGLWEVLSTLHGQTTMQRGQQPSGHPLTPGEHTHSRKLLLKMMVLELPEAASHKNQRWEIRRRGSQVCQPGNTAEPRVSFGSSPVIFSCRSGQEDGMEACCLTPFLQSGPHLGSSGP